MSREKIKKKLKVKKLPKSFDIRLGDVVKLRPDLTNEEKNRIASFASRISKQSDMKNYVLTTLNNLLAHNYGRFEIVSTKTTAKTPTEYSVMTTKDQVRIPIQSRYLRVIERKAKHTLTNIFSDFQPEE